MANINLLPWREEYRQEKKKEFFVQLGMICVFAAVVAFAWVKMVDSAIDAQNERNGLINSEIKILEVQVKEIQELKKHREDLIARIKVIQDLQGTRPTIVRYFDETVRAVPDGLYFNTATRKGGKLSITGITESSNRVSSFMRNLDQSEWFNGPNLRSIKALKGGESKSTFNLDVKLVLPAEFSAEGA